ncbi:protein FAM3C isoform X2 [Clupea harengus]|uniref:Protein FAM3C isoform X2 n=1 Tax=Clupea harengus TaxID=7950 RepID=A0A6P3VZ92_CLUHA|nr:protein FAM3C isoform X2 [Clupea harengus]
MKLQELFFVTGICFIFILTWGLTSVQRLGVQLTDQQDSVNLTSKCTAFKDCPSNHFAFYISSGAADVVGPKICFEGKVIMSGVKNNVGRGLNIVLLDGETGNIVRSSYFKGSDDWLDFLRSIQPGHITLVASFDDPASILTDEAREIFRGLGSSVIQTLGTRDGWVFASQKGSKESPFEKHISNDEKTNRYERWPEIIDVSGCFHKRI